jgi:hypothetical protein
MLQTFYDNFGFMGALGISGLMFILFIFWMAGLAGITYPEDGGRLKENRTQIIIAVLVPIYPIVWLWAEMYRQYRFLNTTQDKPDPGN